MLNNIAAIVGGAAPAVGDYESIQTVTVGSTSQASITFTAIPSTYKHLQIRGISRQTAVSYPDWSYIYFNSDTTSSNYYAHRIDADGSTVTAGASSAQVLNMLNPYQTSTFNAGVIDILDYANTNKYKTVRTLSGYDANGSGRILFTSNLWKNTNAVTDISLTGVNNFVQHSSFALYGIK